MDSKRDVWLEAGVIWAAAVGSLPDGSGQNLTQRAVAMAGKSADYRFMFDYRRAALTHDVLALNRHAELLSRLGLPEQARIVMLCRQRSSNFEFWERVLRMRGYQAAVFTDGEAALSWLHRPATDAATLAPPAGAAPGGTATDALLGVDSLSRMLQRFATERRAAPHGQVVAELTELLECLLAQADQLGIDLMQGTAVQLRRRNCRVDRAS
ncbi:MAG: hypothetical protein WCD08_00925 [Steroidobacteraceae bacterium]